MIPPDPAGFLEFVGGAGAGRRSGTRRGGAADFCEGARGSSFAFAAETAASEGNAWADKMGDGTGGAVGTSAVGADAAGALAVGGVASTVSVRGGISVFREG